MSDGYGTIRTTPEFHFDSGYEAKCETTEESRREWVKLMRETDEDAERFFDVLENDVLCCMRGHCDDCYLDGIDNCQTILEDNFKRMVDNQKRILIAFNKQRKE